MIISKLMAVAALCVAAVAAFAAPRTGPWTKEQAWEWYNAQPWIRGCNYMPASSPNRYDMWQVWDSERRFEEAAKPANVARIYFDNALLTFDGYTPPAKVGLGPWEDATKRVPPCWRDDPRMPVNRAEEIAKAGIKVLLVYGTSDIAVKPSANSKAFLAKFKAAGGNATMLEHSEYGHHPHGVEPDEAKTVTQFFSGEEKK